MPVFPRETQSAVVSGTTQVATFRGHEEERFIDRINITGPANSTCLVYIGSIGTLTQVDGSATGNQDVAEYPNGLYVPAGSPVIFVWNVNTQNPAASATVQWRSTK